MKSKHLYTLWGVLFIICAAAGFIRPVFGPGWLWTGLGLCFFVPPFWLLYRGNQSGDRRTVLLLRYLSLGSLLLTAAALVVNFLGVRGSDTLGTMLHGLLTIVSVPMMTVDIWAVSMFLWAFLLAATFRRNA